MVDPKGMVKARREQGATITESIRSALCLTLIEIDRTLDPNCKLARIHFILIHRNRGVPTRVGTTTTRQIPSLPKFEGTGTSGNDGVPRERALVGDSTDDEERSDNLSSRSLHQATCPKVAVVGNHEPESRQGSV